MKTDFLLFCSASDAFAKLLESGDLKGSSVRLEGVNMPFHHLLARICFHHHFSGTYTPGHLLCVSSDQMGRWVFHTQNSAIQCLSGIYDNDRKVFECQFGVNLQHAIVADLVSPTHVVYHVVYMKGKE